MISYCSKKKRWILSWQSSATLCLCWSGFLSYSVIRFTLTRLGFKPSAITTITCAQPDSLRRKCPLGKFFFFFCYVRAAPVAYGGSQARGWIGTLAAGLHHSHSNPGSEPHLRPTTAHGNAGFLTYWARPGMESTSSWILVRFINLWAMRGTPPSGEILSGLWWLYLIPV